MNTNIRLFNSLGPIGPLQTYLEEFEIQELYDSLPKTLSAIVEENKAGLIPTEAVSFLFELASILYSPDKPEKFKEDILSLLIKKSQDYNADKIDDPNFRLDDARVDYFPFGHWSYLQMLHVKINRVLTVRQKKEINFESVNDSLIDLGSYLIFYYSWLSDLEVA